MSYTILMPIFTNPADAQSYIENQIAKGLVCEQRFTIYGISVTCRLNVGFGLTTMERRAETNVRIVPISGVRPLFETGAVPEKVTKQQIFPQNQNFELPHELRDYQAQAVAFALAHRHAIIELPTGRGKTLTALAIVNEIIKERPRRTLVLVPTTVLLDQWIHDGFEAAGVEASGVGGGEKQWGEYTVSTYQSAIRNLDKIPQYGIVIFDEVHHLFSPEYSKILMTILSSPAPDTKYLIGLTATVREYGEGKTMQNKYFPNIFSKTLEEFQQGNTRIPTEIKEIPVYFSDEEMSLYESYQATIRKANRALGPVPEWPKYMRSEDEATRRLAMAAIRDYAAQKRLLTETPEKLDMILDILQHYPGQFIIFSDTIDGINAIEETLRSHGITEGSIYSGVPATKRREIIQGLRDGSIRVLVGGNAISEGLDLPDISNVILSSMLVKSTRTPVQRLGRVLRPAPGKHVRIFLVYVKNTLEEYNARKIYDILGEG
jgi:superfamily II DNA or RNA helicase